MFLTHNVVNVSWPERALTDDLSRDTFNSPRPPTAKPRPLRLHSVCSFCPQCQVGGTDTHGPQHSRNNQTFNVLSILVGVSASVLVSVRAQSFYSGWQTLTVWQTERQTSLHADWLTDFCCISELVLLVSISNHEPCSLDPVPRALRLTVHTQPWVKWRLPVCTEISLSFAKVDTDMRESSAHDCLQTL